jgi:hypothetical protein
MKYKVRFSDLLGKFNVYAGLTGGDRNEEKSDFFKGWWELPH